MAGVLVILSHARLLSRGLELFRLAIREFFLPQFETRCFPGARPVVTVDHPLDPGIPFVPALVRVYLGFMSVWLRSVGAVYSRFGEAALDDIEGWIRELCLLYLVAGTIYKRCQSTTVRRLGSLLSPHFLLIRLLDPHLHCIPSLHVLIVCQSCMRLRRIVRRRGESSDAPEVAEAYKSALRVIEAVLLVKQHSLADIGPSLFMLSELFPDFDRRQAARFVGELFQDTAGITEDTRENLRKAVLADYRDLQRQRAGRPEAPMEEILLGYILRWRRPSPGHASPVTRAAGS